MRAGLSVLLQKDRLQKGERSKSVVEEPALLTYNQAIRTNMSRDVWMYNYHMPPGRM